MTPSPTPDRPDWLDPALYPFAPRWFSTDESRMHYVDEGRGRPILFVHGTPSLSFEWRHAIDALRGDFRCVAQDHLGFGLSDKPPEYSYSLIEQADYAIALWRQLGVERAQLVAHDYGTSVATEFFLVGSGPTDPSPRAASLALQRHGAPLLHAAWQLYAPAGAVALESEAGGA